MHIGQSFKVDSDDLANPKIIYLGDVLDVEERVVTTLLNKYTKIFTFGYQHMLEMDLNVLVYNIVTKFDAKLVKKKPRCINLARSLYIREEIQKLLHDKFIYLTDYQ